jgi:hypothetical protein
MGGSFENSGLRDNWKWAFGRPDLKPWLARLVLLAHDSIAVQFSVRLLIKRMAVIGALFRTRFANEHDGAEDDHA